jgi:hypothetical protein
MSRGDSSIMKRTGLVVLVAMVAVGGSRAQTGPRIRTLTEQEVLDLTVGTAIQGTRSSDTAGMIRQAKALLAAGKAYRIISVDDLPDDWTVVTAAGGIGGGAWEYVPDRIKQQNLPTVPNATVAALEALSKHLGKKFDAGGTSPDGLATVVPAVGGPFRLAA